MRTSSQYGVEYRVIMRDGDQKIIASIKSTDSRFLRSSSQYADKNEFIENKASDIDFQLLDNEKTYLQKLLANFDVIEHGWYIMYAM